MMPGFLAKDAKEFPEGAQGVGRSFLDSSIPRFLESSILRLGRSTSSNRSRPIVPGFLAKDAKEFPEGGRGLATPIVRRGSRGAVFRRLLRVSVIRDDLFRSFGIYFPELLHCCTVVVTVVLRPVDRG